MRIVLEIGCWGRKHDRFTFCSGTNNELLDLSTPTQRNIDIAEYLDKSSEIFTKPIYNNVHTFVWNIQEKFSTKGKPVFSKNEFDIIEKFCIAHAKCGLYLRIETIGD